MPPSDRPSVLALATSCGYPRTQIRPSEHVAQGKENWEKFTDCATWCDVKLAGEKLGERQAAET